MTAIAVAIAFGVVALLPRTVAACATCISSGFGDRAYTWPYIGLILMPFVIAVGIVGTLAWYAGWRPREIRSRVAAWSARRDLSPRTHTETP